MYAFLICILYLYVPKNLHKEGFEPKHLFDEQPSLLLLAILWCIIVNILCHK